MYPISQQDWGRYRDAALDHGLNAAILTICQRLLPGGFDIAENAPDTYEAIVALFESGKRYVVYAGGSENTIYGDRRSTTTSGLGMIGVTGPADRLQPRR